jgi:hypothetical protein
VREARRTRHYNTPSPQSLSNNQLGDDGAQAVAWALMRHLMHLKNL